MLDHDLTCLRKGLQMSIAFLALALSGNHVFAQSHIEVVQRLNRHAVIIGVGSYSDPLIPALRGVVHDVSNAKQMAHSMGVADTNITVLQDGAATYDNIRKALRDLGKRVRDGDKVFIYYSGHGTRIAVADSPAICREALIPSNAQMSTKGPLLSQEDIAEDLAPVYAKADKVFVFFDACHSGGVKVTNTRSSAIGKSGAELSPKFATLDSAVQCSVPSNVRRRSLVDVAKLRGALPNNVVQISSSRPDEISLDSPTAGGLATEAWRSCSMNAEDLDGSGALSVAEISRCVQHRINVRLKDQPRYTGQNIVISGNTEYSPALSKTSASEISAPLSKPASPSPLAAASILPSSDSGQAPVPVVSQSTTTSRFPLDSLLPQSDARHRVNVQHSTAPLKIGRDFFDIRVQSDRGGYVYLVLQSSDNKSTHVIFPNGLDQDNRISPNQWLQLPRPSWRLKSQGPAGKNRLLVMVTDSPRSLSELIGTADGPFVKTLNDRPAAQALSWLAGTSATYSPGICASTSDLASKDLEYVDKCSDGFGAHIVEISETN